MFLKRTWEPIKSREIDGTPLPQSSLLKARRAAIVK